MIWRVTLFCLLTIASAAYSQDREIVQADMPELSSGPLNASEGVVVVHAGTDKKTAFLRIKKRNIGKSRWQWDLALQAPYDTENDPAVLGNFDGLTTSTNLALNFQRISIRNQPRTPEFEAALDELCVSYGVPTGQGCTDDEIRAQVEKKRDPQQVCASLSAPECKQEASLVARQFKDQEIRINRLLEAQGVLNPIEAWIYGAEGKVGVEQMKYIDPNTFAAAKSSKSPWSLNAYVYFKRGPSAFGGGIEYQDAYKNQQEALVCQPSTTNSTVNICQSGPLGSPLRQERKVIFFQFNHHRAGQYFALAPRVSYDFESDESGVIFPVYLIRNQKGLFTGGLQIGWQSETDEVTAGFFVGKAFTYF